MIRCAFTALLLLWSALFFPSCELATLTLSQDDLDRHVLAYEKLSEQRTVLHELEVEEDAAMIYTCRACQPILDAAVQEAGYTNFEAFLLMDLRIVYTLQYVANLRLAALLDQQLQQDSLGVVNEDFCGTLDQNAELSAEDREEARTYCRHIKAFETFVKIVAKVAGTAASYLFRLSDIDLVDTNYDLLLETLSAPGVPDGLGLSVGMDYDD